MLALNVNGYQASAVLAAVQKARRTWSFRYDLLDETDVLKHTLTGVTSGSVSQDASAKVRRTCKLSFLDDASIVWGHDRVRPWARLLLPDGGHAEFPQGTFLLSTPPKQLQGGARSRVVDGYDKGQILLDQKTGDRYSIAAGSVVTTAISTLLTGAGITGAAITASAATLPVAREYALGTDYWSIIDELLRAINYRPLWFDALGVAQVLPNILPANRGIEYTYDDSSVSVLLPGMSDGADFFAVPNVFIGTVSRADRQVLQSTYTNNNVASQTSVVARGRSIYAVNSQLDAVDQGTLDAAVQRWAAEASAVPATARFTTAIMPMHADLDCYQINHSLLGTSAAYIEQNWSMPLAAGGQMSHVARAAVPT